MVFISILLVKTGFSTSETSAFELFVFIINIVTFFWLMGISNSILSFYHQQEESSKKIFFSNIFYLLQVIGFLTAISVYFTGAFGLASGNRYLLDNNNMLLLAAYILFFSPTLLIELYYILKENNKALSYYGTIIFGLQFFIIAMAVFVFKEINMIFRGMLLWVLIRWFWVLYIVFIKNRVHTLMPVMIKAFMLVSIPVIIHILLSNGMDYIDGILVDKYFPADKFSVYRYGARQFPLFVIMIGALRSVSIAKASGDMETAKRDIKKHGSRLMIFFFPLAIILMFVGKTLFIAFFSEDYIYSAFLFNIYLLTLSSHIIIPEVFLYARKKYNMLMYLSAAELVFNLLLSLMLMKKSGMAGIAFATFVAFFLSKLYLVLYTYIKLDIKITSYTNIKRYAILTVTLYTAFVISLYFNGFIRFIQ